MSILIKLFITFFKIGLCTFGGGYAMLPMIRQEVLSNGWMIEDELIDFLAISESTPGPFAVNISTYVGSKAYGLSGAFIATIGVVLPSFIIILIITKLFLNFSKSKTVTNMMSGLKPAVVGMIMAATCSVSYTVLFKDSMGFNSSFISSILLFVVAIYLISYQKWHPVKIIIFSAIIGMILGSLGIISI